MKSFYFCDEKNCEITSVKYCCQQKQVLVQVRIKLQYSFEWEENRWRICFYHYAQLSLPFGVKWKQIYCNFNTQ